MLRVENVKKSFAGQRVLDNVSLSVERGNVISILGPSGAGKTTLLRCINFLERADEGKMLFDGMEIDMGAAGRKQVALVRDKTGFVFQDYNLFANKTALQNITEGLIVARKMPQRDALKVAESSLQKVDMWDKRDSYPYQLSGGQQQRVAIARAIAARPDVVMFDEPTSALDPELTGEVLSVMRRLAEEGMTMLIVTHEMEFARSASSHILFMEGGRIVEAGPAGEFFTHPKEERTRSFISSILGKTVPERCCKQPDKTLQKPLIDKIDLKNAPDHVRKVLDEHIAEGYKITNEKLTLLHNVAAFDALEVSSYKLDRELQRLIGKQAADFFEYAISLENGCMVCSTYFYELLERNGIQFENFSFTAREQLLIEYGRAMAKNPKHIPDELFSHMKAEFTDEEIIVITTMGLFMLANNYFNEMLRVDVAPCESR